MTTRVSPSMIVIKTLLLFLLTVSPCTANDVLADITARLVKTPITNGEFQQEKRLKILSKPLLATGVFTYHENKGVIWQTLTPVSSLLLVNESHLLTSQGEQIVPATFADIFKVMLNNDVAALAAHFSITAENKATAWQLQLTPKDELLQKVVSRILLSGDTELSVLELHEVSGNLTRIVFSHITHPQQLTPEQQADFERLSP